MVDTIVNVEKTVCRKEYFRQYYQQNKDKYIKENTRNDIEKRKRGRPKKIKTPFSVRSGSFTISFN